MHMIEILIFYLTFLWHIQINTSSSHKPEGALVSNWIFILSDGDELDCAFRRQVKACKSAFCSMKICCISNTVARHHGLTVV